MAWLGLAPSRVTQGNLSSTAGPLVAAGRSGRPTHRSPEPYQEPVVLASTAGRWFAGVAAVFEQTGFTAAGVRATDWSVVPHPATIRTALRPAMARNARM